MVYGFELPFSVPRTPIVSRAVALFVEYTVEIDDRTFFSPLLPLMHWPTFSQHLVSRRDRHDETFRIFLMSLSE